MLVLSWSELDQPNDEVAVGFEVEYYWENFIIRLWLYRATVKTLTKLSVVKQRAESALQQFDSIFTIDGQNTLKALRDMIEHFDDYATGKGHGPADRRDLDPWRFINRDRFERGRFVLDRKKSYDAAINLRSDAKCASDEFIQWLQSPR